MVPFSIGRDDIQRGYLGLAVAIDLLLLLKLYALMYHAVWIRREAKSYKNDFLDAMGEWQGNQQDIDNFNRLKEKYKVLISHDDWPFHRFFNRKVFIWTVTEKHRTFTGWLFALPVLVSAECLIICLSDRNKVLVCGVLLLWLDLWASFLQTFLSRILTDYCDTFLRRVTISHKSLEAADMMYSRTEALRDATYVYVGVIAVVILGYAGIFWGIQRAYFPHAFKEMKQPFDALYFSFIITGTQGIGDSVPISSLAKFFVINHVAITLTMMGFLLASVFTTLNRSELITERRLSKAWGTETHNPILPDPIIPPISANETRSIRKKCARCGMRRVTDLSGLCSKCREHPASNL